MSILATTVPVLLAATTDNVQDGSLLVAIPIAFAAGVLSFLSPCVLPLVPAYLSYITGLSAADLMSSEAGEESRGDAGGDAGGDTEGKAGGDAPDPAAPKGTTRLVVLGSLGFVLGTAVVFVSFGALFGSFGRALQQHSEGLTQIFGVVTILLGLLLAGAFNKVNLANREIRFHRLPGKGLAAAPVIGLTFALGWTPCIGPTLGVVLSLSASSDQASAMRGASLALVYCLGLGIPLLITGLAFNRAMAAFSVIKRHYQTVMVTGGLMLVVLGILQVTGVWTAWMNEVQTRFGGTSLPL